MRKNGFEGWYFKHQKGENMVAFIPGRAKSGPFIQVISTKGSKQFPVSEFLVEKAVIQADRCQFSLHGCKIDLPGITGQVKYGPTFPLHGDIMGPFRFFPMECRHAILSMAHPLQGSLTIDGESYCFDDGMGYIEKDSGTSFPSSYLWLQCNSFPQPCFITLSIARIPFLGFHFQGCICAIVYRGQEYRFATYQGVRIRQANPEHICLAQGKRIFDLEINPPHKGHSLYSPRKGAMSGTIQESCNAAVRVRLWESKTLVFDLFSDYAAYEYVPRQNQQL